MIRISILILSISTACRVVSDERVSATQPLTSTLPQRTPCPAENVARVWNDPDPATPSACRERRLRTAKALGNGLLVLGAGADPDDVRYYSDDDFHWLCGVSSPDAILVLVAVGGELVEERLYLHPSNPRHELWNGPRLAPGESTIRATGIADLRELELFPEEIRQLAQENQRIYCSEPTGQPVIEQIGRTYEPVSPFLEALQVVKDAAEIQALRTAVDITQAALVDAFRIVLPGAHEFTVEATIESGFRRRGAETTAFPSICGSGPNSCILHYRANQRRLEAGDMLVMDVGAKYKRYCADVTRTIPVSARFSPRQREIYTLVYEASQRAARCLRPGASLRDAHQAAQAYLKGHGMDAYFPHGIGHGLGLEVHDAPRNVELLRAGMVVTIEPGIYIAEENLGCRIEDDYLITENGAELLSGSLPSHPDELEDFLRALRTPRHP